MGGTHCACVCVCVCVHGVIEVTLYGRGQVKGEV